MKPTQPITASLTSLPFHAVRQTEKGLPISRANKAEYVRLASKPALGKFKGGGRVRMYGGATFAEGFGAASDGHVIHRRLVPGVYEVLPHSYMGGERSSTHAETLGSRCTYH